MNSKHDTLNKSESEKLTRSESILLHPDDASLSVRDQNCVGRILRFRALSVVLVQGLDLDFGNSNYISGEGGRLRSLELRLPGDSKPVRALSDLSSLRSHSVVEFARRRAVDLTPHSRAEREGFEPSIPRRVFRFSRPVDSTTLAPLQNELRGNSKFSGQGRTLF